MGKLILFFFLICFFGLGFSQNISLNFDNNISSPLLGNWLVPNNVTQIKVQCWGGGGGGGGATGQATAGGGGGGGAFTEKTFSVTPGQLFSYSIGNGGISSYTSGGIGGSTWFQSINTLLAKGGNGGAGSTSACCQTSIGATAVSSGNIGGTINFYGGAGGTGTFGGNGSEAGGGGGGAGSQINGNNGSGSAGGNGGIMGNGNGAYAGAVGCNCFGNIGNLPGGGGSGAQASGVLDKISGAGGGGRLNISYTIPGIGGTVYLDGNTNCSNDAELGLKGIRLVLQPGNLITETDNSGRFAFNFLPIGQYTLTIDTTLLNTYNCIEQQSFNYNDNNLFSECIPFGVQTITQCTSPNVTIIAPYIRPCTSNKKIYISACNLNHATSVLNSAYVDVEIDSLISITNASLLYTQIGPNSYRFQLGNIAIGDCIDFQLNANVSCNAIMGQSVCMAANLFPSESCFYENSNIMSIPLNAAGVLSGLPQLCNQPWDNSNLTVEGWCENDSIRFKVTNSGLNDMVCYSPVMISIDGFLTYTDSLKIPAGQFKNYSYLGDGKTWHLQVFQHPLHPGNSMPIAHVEACANINNWTSNIVNNFPLDDSNPDVDIFCGVVKTSCDPNDKIGYPNGLAAEHFINSNQELQYLVRFQNTGNDTAFVVIVRDTLDINLNIFTVTPGVSSHPYEFKIYGSRILEWKFENILLCDSLTNFDQSNGFLSFTVKPINSITPGTVINNKAGIYFDFNDVVITNETFHTVNNTFIQINGLIHHNNEGEVMKIYPNPTENSITIFKENQSPSDYKIFNQTGSLMQSGKLILTKTEVDLSNLLPGIYFVALGDNNLINVRLIKL